MAKKYVISKSQYIKGMQCPKALWLYRHHSELAPEISDRKQFVFDTGHEVGALAHKHFKGGIEITEKYYEIEKIIESTKEAINQGKQVIFEAGACSKEGVYSRIDILKKVRGRDAWDLIEVKSSTGLKDYHIDDMAIQRYAFTKAGYKIRKSILMHLNNAYVRIGELDVKKLFKLQDCSDIVNKKMRGMKGKVEELITVINKRKEPKQEIGAQCSSPFSCDYVDYCWEHVPEYSVYNLFGGEKLDDLLSKNILDVSDIPDGFAVRGKKRIDLDSYKKNRIYRDQVKIQEFMDSLNYPLYFLDYETIFPAIPLFDNTSPYQQIPFQFSLHIQKSRGGKLKHHEFLHTGADDPRPDFVKALVNSCGSRGSVVVYNKSFEASINDKLAEAFPKFDGKLRKINNRMVDLLIPFRSRHLYHPDMQGSASLKDVLPAFVPSMDYDDLEISDGESASRQYWGCITNTVGYKEKKRIFKNLKAYCRQDTLAESKLIDVLHAQA